MLREYMPVSCVCVCLQYVDLSAVERVTSLSSLLLRQPAHPLTFHIHEECKHYEECKHTDSTSIIPRGARVCCQCARSNTCSLTLC